MNKNEILSDFETIRVYLPICANNFNHKRIPYLISMLKIKLAVPGHPTFKFHNNPHAHNGHPKFTFFLNPPSFQFFSKNFEMAS